MMPVEETRGQVRALGWTGASLLMAVLLVACGETPDPAASSPAAAPKPVAAQSAPEPAGPLEILSVLSVEHEVDVLAQRDGVVVEIHQDQGSTVKRGALLAQMDDRELVAQLDRARADLASAESNVKYNEAEVQARQAALRRATEMRRQGLNSDADLEEAEFRAKGAAFDLEAWKSVVERNQANLRVLGLELEKTQIRAPFDGAVIRRYVQRGQNVLKDEKVFRVGEMHPLRVRFLVPESQGRAPRVGDAVELKLASDGEQAYKARIEKVSPTVDPASGSYEVSAQMDGAPPGLRPGMAVRILWPRANPQ